MMLNAVETRLHGIILGHHADGKVMPSYDEMADALGLRSKSGVARAVATLEARGLIRRLPNRARAIEPVSFAGAAAERLSRARQALDTVTAKVTAGIDVGGVRARDDGPGSVPVAGPASGGVAGRPVGTVDVPQGMLGVGEHVAVVAEGDAMLGAGILAGDHAILGRSAPARDGDIVLAAAVDGGILLGRYRSGADGAASVTSVPLGREAPPPQVVFAVLGRVVGIVRRVVAA